MQLRHPGGRRRADGFSLVEVMVALLVISIGMLGIAKMQALALSNTTGARLRALAAIEADGLSGTLQTDRNFWSEITANVTATIKNGVVSSGDATLNAAINCTQGANAPCTAHQMAAYDLQTWAAYLQQVVGPSGSAALTCSKATATNPVACTVQINWAESAVAANAAENGTNTAKLINGSFTLVVNP